MKKNLQPILFLTIAILVLVSLLAARPADDSVLVAQIKYEDSLGGPIFKTTTAKVAVERLNDGTFMVLWPVEPGPNGARVAMLRVEGVWSTLMSVQHTVLYGDPSVFYKGVPLNELPTYE